ncbi:metalloregulator ArsR/SmtB family transcription factor [Actinoallomurus sp. NPDC052308]|uniref:ArsR/SmtB family transcription factor n=1 Tax=Actinoallomurus sp. NPDC052308 TaxID=3155530 RepID=UPI00341C211B
MPAETRSDALLEVFKALSNPTRLAIMGWLRDPTAHFESQPYSIEEAGVCVKQIQEKAGVSQSTASQFMVVLQRAGLVESTRIGQWTYYRRNEDLISRLPDLLDASV